jgi:hypothetical protein
MAPYTIVVALHAIAAVLGAGQVLALLIVAHGHTPDPAVTIIGGRLVRLLRASGASLGVPIVTGFLLVYIAGGGLLDALWLKVSMGLVIVLGVVTVTTRRRLVRAMAANPARATVLRSVERASVAMCAVVAAIAFLMAAKPF